MNPHERRNASMNIVGETLWGFHANLIPPATVLTVLLTQYGAGARTVGLIAAIESGMLLVPQAFGVYVFHARRGRRLRLIGWHLGVMLPMVLAMAVLTFCAAHLPPALYRALMLAAFALFYFLSGIVIAAWMDFIAHIIPTAVRGVVFGLSLAGTAVGGAVGALTAGALIERVSAPAAFGWLYLLAWVGGMVSICMWLFARDHGADTATDAPPPRWPELVARFRHSLADHNFRHFLAARVLAACGFCIVPFVAVYYTSPEGGALPRGFVVSAFAASTVGMAVASLLLGWLGDRSGHRLGVILGAATQVAALLAVLLVPGRIGCLSAYAAAGVCGACGFVSHYNLVLESCPHDNRIAHISVANLVIGLPVAVAPLGAGFLAGACGLRTLFSVCLALSAAALAWLVLFVRDPRQLAAAEAAEPAAGLP